MTRNAKRLLWLVIVAALLAVPVLAETPIPAPTGQVNDFAGVIDEASRARMETMARNFRDRTGVDVAVVTLKSLEGRPIEDGAIDLARKWGIGEGTDKDGVLLLLAVEDRRTRIETSRKLDDEITDGTAGAILRTGRPAFQAGRYGEGLSVVLESLLATIAEKRGVSIEGIDRSRAQRDAPQQPARGGGSPGLSRIIFYIIVAFVIISILRGFGGGGGGGGGGRRRRYGGGLPWIIPFPLGGGGGGWSGGSSGGWGGGGGDSWGGFGGGGDFGGGGASDSW